MDEIFKDKNILVTGGTGSIGSEIVHRVLKFNPKVVRIFSRDETKQFELEQKLENDNNIRFLIGDIRDKNRLKRAFDGIDIVFHAAAMKHVPACEYNPFEAVQTNVLGTQNIIEAALDADVKKVIAISTDKAASPINTMGATKLLAEKLIMDGNFSKGRWTTIFSSVRFGNVVGSRGSVIPLFKKQIQKGGPITLTNPEMTRFMMTISQAVDLVFKATKIARGGEIFIFKMPVIRLKDLAETMIKKYGPEYGYETENISIKINGIRKGEKMHEKLMLEEEAQFAYETDEMFIVIQQEEYNEYQPLNDWKVVRKVYSSDNANLCSKKYIEFLLDCL